MPIALSKKKKENNAHFDQVSYCFFDKTRYWCENKCTKNISHQFSYIESMWWIGIYTVKFNNY